MISDQYFKGIEAYDGFAIKSCADINEEASRKKAEQFGVSSVSVKELLADPEIELVLNLTIPRVHAEVNTQILEAGKHAYCEKPFARSREEGMKVMELAREKNLQVGCAPDTFLGAGQQTARALIDQGAIGRPIAGSFFMLSGGVDFWHTNPGFYYQPGGGPLLDMGPYYHTTLVNLLGPVKSVTAGRSRARNTRETLHAGTIPVEVDTHYSGILEFGDGVLVTSIFSFDAPGSGDLPCIEIYGSEGTLSVPNPNNFDGDNRIRIGRKSAGKPFPEWEIHTRQFTHAGHRGIGAIDLVTALRNGKSPRASGQLAGHVLDVMLAYDDSAQSASLARIESSCERPAPVSENMPPRTWLA